MFRSLISRSLASISAARWFCGAVPLEVEVGNYVKRMQSEVTKTFVVTDLLGKLKAQEQLQQAVCQGRLETQEAKHSAKLRSIIASKNNELSGVHMR